jgi:hypothetical protein
LAYVFWHWPAEGVAAHHYEQLQAVFHRALGEAGLPGFRGSTSFRVGGRAPWLGGSPAYADWYLVDGSEVLDVLNEAAVSSARRGAHDELARAEAAGVGSLLQLRSSTADVEGARLATWLAKPRGEPYDVFYARLAPVCADPGVSLWRRLMVLGPTPEFGLLSRAPLTQPAGLDSLALSLEPISP